MKNLRLTLLGEIIGSASVIQNKYSMAYNNLSAVIELERNDNKDKLPDTLFKEFETIKQITNNLSNETKNIPFLILEQYYFRNYRDLNREIYIEWKNVAFEMKIKELFLLLEKFFNKIYMLAVKIADYYNLELKLKKTNEVKASYL